MVLFLVEISGIEPLTSWMPFKRTPSWAIHPHSIPRHFLPHFTRNDLIFTTNFQTFSWISNLPNFLTLFGVAHQIMCAPSWGIAPHLSNAAMKQSVVLEVISVRAILLRPQKAFFASLVRKIFVMQGPSWKTNFFLAYLLISCCFIHIVWSNFCIFCQHLFHLHKVPKRNKTF